MILALLGALIIGFSLGMLGSGGSILTVPILIFFLGRPEKNAFIESMVIVGIIAFAGAVSHALKGQIHWKSVLLFGLPGIIGACIGGWCSSFVNSHFQMILFSIIMIISALFMLGGPFSFEKKESFSFNQGAACFNGFLVGGLTGFIGIGGGFLIVPALVLLCSLPMTLAIGTSLAIIVLNSLTGLFGHLVFFNHFEFVNWMTVGILSGAGITGSFAGSYFSQYFSVLLLRRFFGTVLFILGNGILIYVISSMLNY